MGLLQNEVLIDCGLLCGVYYGGMSLRKVERQVSLIVPKIDELVALDHPLRPM